MRSIGKSPGLPGRLKIAQHAMLGYGLVLAGVGKFLEMDRWPRFAPRFWALTWVALGDTLEFPGLRVQLDPTGGYFLTGDGYRCTLSFDLDRLDAA
jgi:hypothetical protein